MFIWLPPTGAPATREAPSKEPEKPHSAPAETDPDFARLPGPDRAIREFAGLPLHWVVLRGWWPLMTTAALRYGQEVLALMRYERTFWGARRGLAKTTEGSWSFRGDLACGKVVIDAFEGDRKLDTVECKLLNSGKGMLSLPNADNYFWEGRTGFGRAERHWLTADGALLVSFKVERGLLTFLRFGTGMVSEIAVQPPATALPELGLLVTLGWYLMASEMDPGGGGG